MRIKQNVFWMAAMAATFSMASCSLEEVVEQPASQAIGFSPFVGKPTKAVTQTTVDELKGETGGFKVWGGYNNSSNVFDGRDVTWSDPVSQMDAGGSGTGAWGYTGTEYWVPGQTYKFAAVGPISVLGAENAATLEVESPAGSNASFAYDGGHLSFDYSLTDLTKSVDVVYAEATQSTQGQTFSNDPGAVSFSFGHIMSWIKIKFVHKMTSGYKITVSDVSVTGVKTGAKFTGSDASTGNGGTGTWTDPNTDAYLGANSSATVNPDIFSDGASSSPLDADGESCLVDFIAIPQTIPQSAVQKTEGNFTISFKLKVQDSKGTYLLGGEGSAVAFSTTMSSDQTWAVNNVYVYTANLTADVIGLNPIEFTASVEGWPTSDSGYNESKFPDPTQKSN